MKKTNITIPFDDEKLTALRRYAEKENAGIDAELEDAVQKIYEKYVPKAVREYFELRDGEDAPAPKKTGKVTPKKTGTAKAPAAKPDAEKEEPDAAGTPDAACGSPSGTEGSGNG